MLFSIGNGPVWGYEKISPENEPDINYDNMGGYVSWMKGENFQPLIKQTVDPGTVQAAEMAENKISESTIYRQALGEPVSGSNASYSMVSLLNHAGRLPLTAPKQGSGWVMGSAMQIAFEMMRKEKVNKILTMEGGTIEIDPKQIPQPLLVDGVLEINLPQDQRINALTANQITQGEKPLASRRWARENLLGIGQSNKMTNEIWEEMFADIESMNAYATQLEQANQRITQARQTSMANTQPTPQGGQGGPGQIPGGPGGPQQPQPNPTNQPAGPSGPGAPMPPGGPGQNAGLPPTQPGQPTGPTRIPGGRNVQQPGGIPGGVPGQVPVGGADANAGLAGIPPEVLQMDEQTLRKYLQQMQLPPDQIESVVQMVNQVKNGTVGGPPGGGMPGGLPTGM